MPSVPPRQDTRTRRPQDKFGAQEVSFPTPNENDIIITVEVGITNPTYEPLARGTPHPTIARAKLVYESPVKGNAREKTVKRIYATDRASQELYNYALSIETDLGFPTVLRTYVVERDTYERAPDYDPDPDITGAVLVKEDMKPMDPSEIISTIFVHVYRVYMQLPGSPSISLQVDENLGKVTVTKRAVRTTNSPANAAFAGRDYRLNYEEKEDMPLVSIETREDWVVADIPVRKGQRLDNETGVGLQFSEHVETFDPGNAPASLGTANTDITPNGPQEALVRVQNSAVITAALATIHRSYAIEVNLNNLLPDELISVVGVFGENKGEGSSASTGVGAAGAGASLSLSLPASTNSSISLIPETSIGIRQVWAPRISAMAHYFYLNGSSITKAAILAKLTSLLGATVNAWPNFQPQRHTLVLIGRQLNLSAKASSHESASSTFITTGSETGHAKDTGLTVKTVEIPATLHGAITIANNLRRNTISASAASIISAGSGGWVGVTSGGTVGPITVAATITPSTLPATTPAANPISGLYLVPTYAVTTFNSSNSKIYAEIVDMSTIASPAAGLCYVGPTSYSYDALAGGTPIPIQPLQPVSAGGVPTVYAISPSTTSGLSFSTTTGVISGTLANAPASNTYTITATAATGAPISTTVTLEVV